MVILITILQVISFPIKIYLLTTYQVMQYSLGLMPPKKSTKERKMYGLRLEKALMQAVQHLGVDFERNANDLVEEALRDLLKKYKRRGKV